MTTTRVCTRCSATLTQNDKYCSFCGLKIDSKTKKILKVNKKLDLAIKHTDMQKEEPEKCINCGSTLEIYSKTCKRCGIRKKKCPVCLQFIYRSDKVGTCPKCSSEFHFQHLRGTITITEKCPACQSPLKEKEIKIS